MNAKLYQRCLEIASALKIQGSGKSNHIAFAFKGRKIVRIGQNSYLKAHRANRFGVYKNVKNFASDYKPSEHAEISLASKLGLDNLRDHRILVVRVSPTGSVGQSCPCLNCRRVYSEAGVKFIYHSNSQGELEKLKL